MRSDSFGIAPYLDEELVLFLDTHDQKEALSQLVGALAKKGKLLNKEAFYTAILERERVVSTGIGLGVAIPHAKLEGYTEFFIAIGVQRDERGIEWHSLDGTPVRLIFLIGGPDHRQSDYLNILSLLTTMIKDPVRRKELLAAPTSSAVCSLLSRTKI